MNPDPDYQTYLRQWSSVYHQLNYDSGLSGFFLRKSHEWAEREFTDSHHFSRVLEVGAGTGVHLSHVRHSFDEYFLTDSHPEMLDQMVSKQPRSGRLIVDKQDATCLAYPDQKFDRLIAAHVLEHLDRPHQVLREWSRVVRPGGIMSILLPCDPGMAWRFGRAIGSRKKFKKAGIEYDYWMAREHINPINSLVSLIQYYFDDRSEGWHPMRVPSVDLNLFYVCHAKV